MFGRLATMLSALAITGLLQAPAQAAPIADEVYGCARNVTNGGCPLSVPDASTNLFVIFPLDATPSTATPGAGVEFGVVIAAGYQVTLDIGDDTVAITYQCSDCAWEGFEFALTGIDSVDITSLALLNAGGTNYQSLAFTSDSMRMRFGADIVRGSKTATFAFTATPNGVVSEPATLALVALAVFGLGALRRKQC